MRRRCSWHAASAAHAERWSTDHRRRGASDDSDAAEHTPQTGGRGRGAASLHRTHARTGSQGRPLGETGTGRPHTRELKRGPDPPPRAPPPGGPLERLTAARYRTQAHDRLPAARRQLCCRRRRVGGGEQAGLPVRAWHVGRVQDTLETLPRHFRDFRDTSETLPRHFRDTSETLPRHLPDKTALCSLRRDISRAPCGTERLQQRLTPLL